MESQVYNPPPGWPKPPPGWKLPPGWKPDPSWPPAPEGWQLWLPRAADPVAPSLPASAPVVVEPVPPPPPPIMMPPAATAPPSATGEADILRAEVARLNAELMSLRASHDSTGIVELDDERVLQEVGIYHYHHPLENAAGYRDHLIMLQVRIASMVKDGEAILASDMFTYNNSLAKGRKMTSDFSRLMLRAYNAEADNCVRALRAGNVVTAKQRLNKAVESIAKLGSMMEMRVNPEYHHLRFEEIELTADYLMKVHAKNASGYARSERLRRSWRLSVTGSTRRVLTI